VVHAARENGVPTRLLILGLDGATFDLIEPWAADGSLPHLARLMAGGAWGRLRSTVPPATFPAWTSLMTGVNPGQHGIFDFTRRIPGTYRLEFLNATYRRRPSVWRLLSDAGQRVAIIGLPATYPPEPLNGLLISGFDAPVATGIDRSFVYPPALFDGIRRVIGPYEITDFQELRIGPGWHEAALDKLLHAAARRTAIAAYLLDREPWDCFFVHFGESDTVAHHFWAFHDPESPRHACPERSRRVAAPDLSRAIHTVYRALDRAVGDLLAHAGEGATVMIVSDHGSGGSGEWIIHLNRWLERQGWLRFAAPRLADRAVGQVKRLGLALPAALQEWAFRGPLRSLVGRLESSARLSGIDWAGTQAFSEEVNTCPAIWLNVQGREPLGTVAPREYEHRRDEILARLAGWRNPQTGEPVVARAWRREELYHGPAVESAPDIVLEPALDKGYSYTLLSSGGQPGEPLRKLAPAERLGAKGGSMNGSHRPEGVFLLAGAGARPGVRLSGAQIVDVAPTLLRLLGAALPADLEGRVLAEALVPGGEARREPERTARTPAPSPYIAADAAVVSRRLQSLGYRE
jgi:predicted AlkP superfamily phosphohydrolase/phosphomutase